jgi:hypothetical protein
VRRRRRRRRREKRRSEWLDDERLRKLQTLVCVDGGDKEGDDLRGAIDWDLSGGTIEESMGRS